VILHICRLRLESMLSIPQCLGKKQTSKYANLLWGWNVQ